MGLDSKWNFKVGSMKHGKRNLITDVPGVKVGHCTLNDGKIQTGVTAVLPHGGNIFKDKVTAACHVINGFGKTVGLVQIEELGNIETPIVLTNTLSVGTASTALVKYMLRQNEDIGDTTGTVNPVVGECNDGYLNDIRGMHIQEDHVIKALESCKPDFEEGSVGAGRGMRCHGYKGGIGSSSRTVTLDSKDYTVGALLLANHALAKDLTVAGKPVGELLKNNPHEDKGSVIIILATDIPLNERQLKRLCKRSVIGITRAGSFISNGSGDIAIAFTTANNISHYPSSDIIPQKIIHEDVINELFRAVAECVEESVLSALLSAETVTGRNGNTLYSLAGLI